MKKVKKKGVAFIDFENAKKEEEEYLHYYFTNKLRPLLSPYVIGKKQPFPFLRNKDIFIHSLNSHKSKAPRIGYELSNDHIFSILTVAAKKAFFNSF